MLAVEVSSIITVIIGVIAIIISIFGLIKGKTLDKLNHYGNFAVSSLYITLFSSAVSLTLLCLN